MSDRKAIENLDRDAADRVRKFIIAATDELRGAVSRIDQLDHAVRYFNAPSVAATPATPVPKRDPDPGWFPVKQAPTGSYLCLWSPTGTTDDAEERWMPMDRAEMMLDPDVGGFVKPIDPNDDNPDIRAARRRRAQAAPAVSKVIHDADLVRERARAVIAAKEAEDALDRVKARAMDAASRTERPPNDTLSMPTATRAWMRTIDAMDRAWKKIHDDTGRRPWDPHTTSPPHAIDELAHMFVTDHAALEAIANKVGVPRGNQMRMTLTMERIDDALAIADDDWTVEVYSADRRLVARGSVEKAKRTGLKVRMNGAGPFSYRATDGFNFQEGAVDIGTTAVMLAQTVKLPDDFGAV